MTQGIEQLVADLTAVDSSFAQYGWVFTEERNSSAVKTLLANKDEVLDFLKRMKDELGQVVTIDELLSPV